MKDQFRLVEFNLNGKDVACHGGTRRASLTDMLRGDYSMTSVKKGCEVGECGGLHRAHRRRDFQTHASISRFVRGARMSARWKA